MPKINTAMSSSSGGIAFVIPFLGQWPSWSLLFFKSCASNVAVDFILLCEQPPPFILSKNVRLIMMSREEIKVSLEKAIGLTLPGMTGHKLCDFRPFFGIAFADVLKNYTFWGYCDIDMMFGDLSKLLTSDFFDSTDVFSAHNEQLVGHFTLLRNTRHLNEMCFRIPSWKERCLALTNQMLDEKVFAATLQTDENIRWRRPEALPAELKSSFCCFGITFDFFGQVAFLDRRDIPIIRWENGKVFYNSSNGETSEALYFHFMGLKRWWHWILFSRKHISLEQHVFSRIGYGGVSNPSSLVRFPWAHLYYIQCFFYNFKKNAGKVLRRALPLGLFLKLRRVVFGRGRY
jgi:hypothetical protein